jgi:hypothetical protein
MFRRLYTRTSAAWSALNTMTCPRGIMVAWLTVALATVVEAKAVAERLADFEASFVRTGEVESCLQLHRIHDTRAIDTQHILFRTGVSRYYLNTLPHAFGSLTVHRGFVIDQHSLNYATSTRSR